MRKYSTFQLLVCVTITSVVIVSYLQFRGNFWRFRFESIEKIEFNEVDINVELFLDRAENAVADPYVYFTINKNSSVICSLQGSWSILEDRSRKTRTNNAFVSFISPDKRFVGVKNVYEDRFVFVFDIALELVDIDPNQEKIDALLGL